MKYGQRVRSSERSASASNHSRSRREAPDGRFLMTGIHFLSRLDAKGKVVLPWRDRARGELRENARPVVRFVEIENHYSPGVGEFGVELAAHGIGFLPARFIAEHDEVLFFVSRFVYGLQAMLLAVHFEHERAGTGVVLRCSDHGCDCEYLGRFVWFEPCLDAPFRIDGKIIQTLEIEARRVFFVLHAYSELVPALDDVEAERADCEDRRIGDPFCVRMENHRVHDRVFELYLRSGPGFEAYDPVFEPD